MPFNGSGVFQRVRNWVADATAGIKIRADYHDAEDDGFAAGLTNTITKDGQTLITQNIPFNSKRITGLADPINPQDAATKASVDAKVAAGGVMTGDIQIKKANPSLTIHANPSGANTISGVMNDKQRWLLRPGSGGAETGGNVGSDFDIHRYGDDGGYLGQALNINRASGAWSIGGAATVNGALTANGRISAGGFATRAGESGGFSGNCFNFNWDGNVQMYVDSTYIGPVATHGFANTAASNAAAGKINRSGDTMGGQLVTAGSGNHVAYNDFSPFEVTGNGGQGAFMSFHRPGAFRCNFGLMDDHNIYYGGQSFGQGTMFRFWTTRDFQSLPSVPSIPGHLVTDTRLNYVQDVFHIDGGGFNEPHGGCVVTGNQEDYYNPGGGGYGSTMRYRALQIQIDGNWYTVNYTG